MNITMNGAGPTATASAWCDFPWTKVMFVIIRGDAARVAILAT